jgi:hypothetical protein
MFLNLHFVARSALLLIALAVLAAASRAAEPPGITNLKAEVGFSTWPGKGGPLKGGLNFQPSD